MGLQGLNVIHDAPDRTAAALLVRYGYLLTVGHFSYGGPAPRCGSLVVLRSTRGTELGTVLAACGCGCPIDVGRDTIDAYIAESGGHSYPFTTEGRVLRIATAQDLQEQAHIDSAKPQYIRACRELIAELDLPMRLVDVELLLGGEMATFYFVAPGRIDFRNLVKQLASRFRTRIQMHQVGSRDEARIAADYETCGQHCCCRQFLKVLRPINMGSAKLQKATLDPTKVSGRCGRLKCCLRFEEQTYDELRRKLPRVGSRVRTAEGPGTVIETMLLAQLLKVRLDADRVIAVANDELLERDLPASAGAPDRPTPADSPLMADDTEPTQSGARDDEDQPKFGASDDPPPLNSRTDPPPPQPASHTSPASARNNQAGANPSRSRRRRQRGRGGPGRR